MLYKTGIFSCHLKPQTIVSCWQSCSSSLQLSSCSRSAETSSCALHSSSCRALLRRSSRAWSSWRNVGKNGGLMGFNQQKWWF